jgi:CheY-like chemotaxis protein
MISKYGNLNMKIKTILIVEDNFDDLLLLKEFLKNELSQEIKILEAKDGQEAIDKVKQNEPELILLDLNLPKVNGSEVLREVKRDIRFRHIPVIIFSSSNAYSDISESYRDYANAYLVKPYGIQQLKETLSAIKAFWIDTVVIDKGYDNGSMKE